MALYFCRWRNLLIYMCMSCILMVLLFIYISIMVCLNMASLHVKGQPASQTRHFVAQGTYKHEGLAPLPKTFWDLQPNRLGIWNQLQLVIDRYFNPILSPRKVKRKYRLNVNVESMLMEGFFRAQDSNISGGLSSLPYNAQEFIRYMHRREYPILIEPQWACGAGVDQEEGPPLLLLAIKTTELNFENRQAIRQTWGQVGWVSGQRWNSNGGGGRGGYVRRVFLLGKGSYEETGLEMLELLQLENKHHGDILQWNFRDSFFNLTLKDVLFWGWYSRKCRRTQFVFKGDDDIFVNIPALVDYLGDLQEKPGIQLDMTSFMVGDVIGAAHPNRANMSKYYVPKTFYKGLYPAYAGGGGVVYSGLLTKRLYNISKRVHLFPIDDVYVGMCMVRLNAFPIHHPAFLMFDFPKDEEKALCAYHKTILVHKRMPSQVTHLWAQLKARQPLCWNVTLRRNK